MKKWTWQWGCLGIFGFFCMLAGIQACISPHTSDHTQNKEGYQGVKPDDFRDFPPESIFEVRYNDGSNDSVAIYRDEEVVKTCVAQVRTNNAQGLSCLSGIVCRLEKGTKVRIISSDNVHSGWSQIQALDGNYEGEKGFINNVQLGKRLY